jgi:hypothetical protein
MSATKPCVGAPFCRKRILFVFACEGCWGALPKTLREEIADAVIAARKRALPEDLRRLRALEVAAREVIRHARLRRRRARARK